MSASAVYTTVTVQPHVQTLLDPSTVRVTILSLEMEKRAAILRQVKISYCDLALLWNKCDKLDISLLCEVIMEFGRSYFYGALRCFSTIISFTGGS